MTVPIKVLPTSKDPYIHSPDSKRIRIDSAKPIDPASSSTSSLNRTEISESTSSQNCISYFFQQIGSFFISIWNCIRGVFKKSFTSNLIPTGNFKEICEDIPKFFRTIYPDLHLPDEPPTSDFNYVCKETNETLFHLLCAHATKKVYEDSISPFAKYYKLHITHFHVQYALDMGADTDKTNGSGDTGLHLAKTKETAELLISQNPKLVYVRNQFQQIPLHHVNWDLETATLLIKNGSDVHAEDKFGNKPIVFAFNPAVRNFLQEKMQEIRPSTETIEYDS